MTSLIHLETLWQFKYNQIEKEIELFKKDFARNKECSCKNIECKHYKKEEKKLFNDRLNKLIVGGLSLNARTMVSPTSPPIKL